MQSTSLIPMLSAVGASLAVGVAGSLIASVIWVPLQSAFGSYTLAKCLGRPFRWRAPKWLKQHNWKVRWDVKSTNFPPQNIADCKLFAFFNVVGGEWVSPDLTGTPHTYRMIGTRKGQYLTVRWFDKDQSGLEYTGVAQLRMIQNGKVAEGVWVGFSREGPVVRHDLIRLYVEA